MDLLPAFTALASEIIGTNTNNRTYEDNLELGTHMITEMTQIFHERQDRLPAFLSSFGKKGSVSHQEAIRKIDLLLVRRDYKFKNYSRDCLEALRRLVLKNQSNQLLVNVIDGVAAYMATIYLLCDTYKLQEGSLPLTQHGDANLLMMFKAEWAVLILILSFNGEVDDGEDIAEDFADVHIAVMRGWALNRNN